MSCCSLSLILQHFDHPPLRTMLMCGWLPGMRVHPMSLTLRNKLCIMCDGPGFLIVSAMRCICLRWGATTASGARETLSLRSIAVCSNEACTGAVQLAFSVFRELATRCRIHEHTQSVDDEMFGERITCICDAAGQRQCHLSSLSHLSFCALCTR